MSLSTRYVIADLSRNPRRTLATMVGVVLGVGLFCGVLFFVDGLSASMTQRALAPLTIDMQRIVTQGPGAELALTESVEPSAGAPERHRVALVLQHDGQTPANEVTVRSVPSPGLEYVAGSARIDGRLIDDVDGNPFATGPARAGLNLGTVEPGTSIELVYEVGGVLPTEGAAFTSTSSSRESVNPVPANRPPTADLRRLASEIATIDGVARAVPLSAADLGRDAIRTDRPALGAAKVFGFDQAYADGDRTIEVVDGGLAPGGAVVSAEVARELDVEIGEPLTIDLPDGSAATVEVTGIADLSRARSLFSSRRGGDLETFIYVPYSVIVSADRFAETIFPAYERAAAEGDGRLKSPPIREIDIAVDRERLDADPATAVTQTEQIASSVMEVAEHQDYLLDNVTNTLHVAAADAGVAKRLFVVLGLPGALLAAMLAAYAGNVLAEAQRREQAILRIRGANRRHLLRMLAWRTGVLTAVGAAVGLVAGYLVAAAILGGDSLGRASTASLVGSAVVGTIGGYVATGSALYVTGRRSIDRDIHDDRRRLADTPPLWWRARLDLVGVGLLVVGTVWALRSDAFAGAPGSVYFGRSVDLNLPLLTLPIAAWVAGSLLGARVGIAGVRRTAPESSSRLGSITSGLARRSVGRRPWAIGNAAIVVALVVALATTLAAFTASYDQAKTADARYANGADIRITPSPTSDRAYTASDGAVFAVRGITEASPVVYGLSNTVLRSDRTSDPANVAAIDPTSYRAVAPLDTDTDRLLATLAVDEPSILVSREMADFLQAQPGDTLHVLLARATPDQTEIDLTITGTYERLPGFPDGADAVVHLQQHTASVPAKLPDFFLAATTDDRAGTLADAVDGIRAATADDGVQIDTRASTLDRDQSSLASLNIAGLVDLDTVFSLAMVTAAIGIFVFGLLLQRRREYVVLRAQGVEPRTVRTLIAFEAATASIAGAVIGVLVGAAMGFYFVSVLRPLFVLDPAYRLPIATVARPVALVLVATVASAVAGSRLVNTLRPTELLRDE
jgi:putative ABC transport system permease protein